MGPVQQNEQNSYCFNDGYRESIRLTDGTPVTLRLVIPADKSLLAHGMDRFSPESRYQRFLAGKQALNDPELRYLTELDGIDHFAIGALLGPEEGIGVARFVRFGVDHDAAEPAVAVLDGYQNRGLGSILFARLMAAAAERGVTRFHGAILPSNRPMQRLLHALGQELSLQYKDGLLEFEIPLRRRCDTPRS